MKKILVLLIGLSIPYSVITQNPQYQQDGSVVYKVSKDTMLTGLDDIRLSPNQINTLIQNGGLIVIDTLKTRASFPKNIVGCTVFYHYRLLVKQKNTLTISIREQWDTFVGYEIDSNFIKKWSMLIFLCCSFIVLFEYRYFKNLIDTDFNLFSKLMILIFLILLTFIIDITPSTKEEYLNPVSIFRGLIGIVIVTSTYIISRYFFKKRKQRQESFDLME